MTDLDKFLDARKRAGLSLKRRIKEKGFTDKEKSRFAKHPWNYGLKTSLSVRKKLSFSHRKQIPWNKGRKDPLRKIKRKARTLINNMIRDKRIQVASKCGKCGRSPGELKYSWNLKKRKITAHHQDYTKPMDVTWLCTDCHEKNRADRMEYCTL